VSWANALIASRAVSSHFDIGMRPVYNGFVGRAISLQPAFSRLVRRSTRAALKGGCRLDSPPYKNDII
jgi:hypothetical protein